ncbi:MAG: hypothetical protein AAGF59_08030 [Pseudomonadota bacterium]
MILQYDTSVSVRTLGVAEIDAYRDHLLRLDEDSRQCRFGDSNDDAGILAYCLNLTLGPTVVIAAFNRDDIRAACEIKMDSDSGTADLFISQEREWCEGTVGRDLMRESLIACFTLGAETVTVTVGPQDRQARALATRFGFDRTGVSAPGPEVAAAFSRPLPNLTPVLAVG